MYTKTKLRKKILMCLAISLLILFGSCSLNNQKEEDISANDSTDHERQRIAVVFNTSLTGGDSGFILESLKNYMFVSAYGLTQQSPEKIPEIERLEDGFMEKYVLPALSFRYASYPEDFTRHGIARISDLTELANDKYLSTVILIDPPARTDRYIAQIKESNPEITFYCLMPTEDILAMEAWCKNVLSFAVNTSIESSEDAETKPIDEENLVSGIKLLTEAAILEQSGDFVKESQEYPEISGATPKTAAGAFLPVETFLKLREKVPGTENWEISHYTDPDTGLKSQNHFVIKPSQTPTGH